MFLRARCADDIVVATHSADRNRRAERGVALIATLLILMVVSAVGLGLAFATSVEPVIASAHEASLTGGYAAEAGLAIALHELRDVSDWSLILSGRVRSAILQSSTGARMVLPDGSQTDVATLTNLANCGHTAACSNAELDAFSSDRPWGPNNPRWQFFGHARLDDLISGDSAPPPCEVVVWIGDDAAELDGDPQRDSQTAADGTRRPGAGIVVIRAESYGVRSAHRVLTMSVSRALAPGAEPRIVAWREIR